MGFQPGAKAMEWRLVRERHFARISRCRVNGTSVNGSPPGRGQKREPRLFPDDQRNTLTQRIDAFLCALMESVTMCMKSPASQDPLSGGGGTRGTGLSEADLSEQCFDTPRSPCFHSLLGLAPASW